MGKVLQRAGGGLSIPTKYLGDLTPENIAYGTTLFAGTKYEVTGTMPRLGKSVSITELGAALIPTATSKSIPRAGNMALSGYSGAFYISGWKSLSVNLSLSRQWKEYALGGGSLSIVDTNNKTLKSLSVNTLGPATIDVSKLTGLVKVYRYQVVHNYHNDDITNASISCSSIIVTR